MSLWCIDAEIEKRCNNCLGIFFTKIVNDPDGESANKEVRRQCILCSRRCNTWCTGCRTVLCFSPPQGGKVRVKKTFRQRRTWRVKKLNRNKKKKKKTKLCFKWTKQPTRNWQIPCSIPGIAPLFFRLGILYTRGRIWNPWVWAWYVGYIWG